MAQGHEIPQFANFEEARQYFLSKLLKSQHNQDMLFALRDVLIRIKSSIRIDPRKELAVAVGEDSYLAGQLALLEDLLSSGAVVADESAN